MNELALRPSYWASVSGGKDSLYMLYLILKNPEKYPLDGVVHFELEIDYPFIRDVTNLMERACNEVGVKFVRIKPEKSWFELYRTVSKTGKQYAFPTRGSRWCNSAYKLNAKKQLKTFMRELGFDVISYIGYCVDEKTRYEKRHNVKEIYPLVEQGIEENTILEWAKTQPIFNNYYKVNKRCGCMYCPISSYMNYAYLLKYYPVHFYTMIAYMRETEKIREKELNRAFSVISSNPKYNADYLEKIIKTKWLQKLNEKESEV